MRCISVEVEAIDLTGCRENGPTGGDSNDSEEDLTTSISHKLLLAGDGEWIRVNRSRNGSSLSASLSLRANHSNNDPHII